MTHNARLNGTPPVQGTPSLADRFWSRVDRSGGEDACWPWLKYIVNHRGNFFVSRQVGYRVAHEVAYELTYGAARHKRYVLHTCTCKSCCNPKHLVALADTTAHRFWSKVDMTGGADACWPWIGAMSCGYGHFGISRDEIEVSSRVAWRLTFGAIPNKKLVCHHCDNRACCNPAHLFIGTHADNTADMVRKGRNVPPPRGNPPPPPMHGVSHPQAKLNDTKVLQIRALRESGMTCHALAKQFNVTATTISYICNRRIWRHLP